MTPRIRKTLAAGVIAPRMLAAGLVGCLLLLNGLVYAKTVEHASHHGHHAPSTHASALCTWICAAGQGLDGISLALPVHSGLVTLLVLPVTSEPSFSALHFVSSRAPPAAFR